MSVMTRRIAATPEDRIKAKRMLCISQGRFETNQDAGLLEMFDEIHENPHD